MQRDGRWATIAAGLALAAALAGCNFGFDDPAAMEAAQKVAAAYEQQARAAQQTVPVGQTMTLPSGATLTVEKVGHDLAGVTAPAGERLVVVDVVVANKSQAPLDLSTPDSFWITDINGRRYLPKEARGLSDPALAPGAEARGTLVFSVTAAASDLRFGWQLHPMTAFTLG
jgi:hypothetical protein